MYNQAQGVYPQLAGSFTNVPGMSPHDNGRAATQVPTMGPMQSYFNAGDILAGQGNIPFGQSHLRSHADATSARLGVYGAAASIGAPAALTYGAQYLGGLAGIGGIAAVGATALGLPSVFEYAKARNRTREMQQMMAGVHVAPGLRDLATGGIHKGAANQLYNSLSGAAGQLGGTTKDLLSTTQMAGQMGMLSGHGQSVSAITSRVMDLAKASRDIISLGEGISLSDAMQLQQITQDIGISNAKFRGMGIGKTLLAGAKAANMTLQEATQVGLGGAQLYSQLGFSSAAGMQAGIQSSIGAATLVNNGVFSASQLARLGGQSGIQQNLLETGAMSLAGISQNLISGAVRFNESGEAYIDRNLLDRYMRGEVSAEEMQKRGQRIRRLPRSQQALIRTQMRRAMPELMESISEQYGPNAQMGIAAREIMSLRASRGMNVHDAAYQYFGGDQAKVETFMAFAQNYPAMMDEQRRQEHQQFNEQMASSRGLGVNRAGLGYRISSAASGVYDFIATPGRLFGQYMDRKEAAARNEAMGVFGSGRALVRTGPRRFRGSQVELSDLQRGVVGAGDTSGGLLSSALDRLAGTYGTEYRGNRLEDVFGDLEASAGSSVLFSNDAGLQALLRVQGRDLGDYMGALGRGVLDLNEEGGEAQRRGLRQAARVALQRYRDIQAPMSLGFQSASFFDVGRRQGLDRRTISRALTATTTEFARRFRGVTQAGSTYGVTYTQGSSLNLSVDQMRDFIRGQLGGANVDDATLDRMAQGVIAQLKRDGDEDVRGGIAKVESNDRALASLVRGEEGAAGVNSIIDVLGIEEGAVSALMDAGMSGQQVADFLSEYGGQALAEAKVTETYMAYSNTGKTGHILRQHSEVVGRQQGVTFNIDAIIRDDFRIDPDSRQGRAMKAVLERMQTKSGEGFTVSRGGAAGTRSGAGLMGRDALAESLENQLRNDKAREYLDRIGQLEGGENVAGYLRQFNTDQNTTGLRDRFRDASNLRSLVGEEFYNRYVATSSEARGELQEAFEQRGGEGGTRRLLGVMKAVADRAQEAAGGGRGGSGGVTTAQALKSVSEAIDQFKNTMRDLAARARSGEGQGDNAITIRIVGS
jgi:hypothetical protein